MTPLLSTALAPPATGSNDSPPLARALSNAAAQLAGPATAEAYNWRLTPQASQWPPSLPARSERPAMEVADWDALYVAVESRLRAAVGQELGVLPNIPAHAASLAASLVQAIVLDCVSALEQLHEALKQEREQRTPH